MAPLSAASMESYSRAYPHLTRLHMLQELADAAALRQVCSAARSNHHLTLILTFCWQFGIFAHGDCSRLQVFDVVVSFTCSLLVSDQSMAGGPAGVYH